MRARAVVPLAILAAFPIAGAASAQRSAEPPRRTFTERVEVRVINLEAVVVDRRHERVRGLGPEDFSLEVDGRPVPIEYFSEIADGLAVAPPAGSRAGLPAAPEVDVRGARVPTSYLVFIDGYFARRVGRRNRILRDIEESLGRLGPGDRMAIVAFTGRQLIAISRWSSQTGQLARAFARARALPACGWIHEDRTVPSDVCAPIKHLEWRIERVVSGVTAALRSFGRPPGRKVMLLLSGGWPHSARHYVAGGRLGAIECGARGPALYRPIFDTANRLGYTLYPVDMPLPGPVAGVSAALAAPVADPAPLGATFELHATLRRLAEETGGTAMIDGAAEQAFGRVVDDTRTYYWLGFTPRWQGDDSRHRVELRVLRPGLEVRSRGGYVDLSLEAEISNVTESALLFGDLPGAHALGLEIGAMPSKGRGKLTVPVKLIIPMDAITMLPSRRGFAAELELRVAVVDDGGNRNEMPIIPVLIEGPDPPPPGSHSVYETRLKLRRRPHDLVISLYDPLSDTILAATGSLGVEPAP